MDDYGSKLNQKKLFPVEALSHSEEDEALKLSAAVPVPATMSPPDVLNILENVRVHVRDQSGSHVSYQDFVLESWNLS